MIRSVYIIGAPGSGKSTAMAQLIQGWAIGPYTRWQREVFGHYLEHPEKGRGAYLGHMRPEFPGTDALSLSGGPRAVEWLEALPLLGLDWVFGEGVRLSHMGFLTALHEVTELTVVYLDVAPEIAAQRRLERGGKQLSDTFCKIQTTKAANVAAACREAGIKVLEKLPAEG
jgi:GTPase SAR1 family protein